MHIKNYREIRNRINDLVKSINAPLNNGKIKSSDQTLTVSKKISRKIQELDELSNELEDSILEHGC